MSLVNVGSEMIITGYRKGEVNGGRTHLPAASMVWIPGGTFLMGSDQSFVSVEGLMRSRLPTLKCFGVNLQPFGAFFDREFKREPPTFEPLAEALGC